MSYEIKLNLNSIEFKEYSKEILLDVVKILKNKNNLKNENIIVYKKELEVLKDKKNEKGKTLEKLKTKLQNSDLVKINYFKIPKKITIKVRYDLLNKEIEYFNKKIEYEKNFQEKNIILLMEILDNLIKDKFKNIQISIFGSYANKLNLPTSDIDLILYYTDNNFYNENSIFLLKELYEFLKEKDIFIEHNFISSTYVPVIKLTSIKKYHNKKIDITFKQGQHLGLDCVQLINYYNNYYKNLKSLLIVLKQFVFNGNLYDTYQGGINSYGLVLMIVSFFQLHKNNEFSKINNLGVLWVEFLKFYISFDQSSYIWTPYYNEYNFPFVKKIMVNPNIEIIDPLLSTNNVTRSCYNYYKIESLFRIGLFKLFESNTKILKNFWDSAKIFSILT